MHAKYLRYGVKIALLKADMFPKCSPHGNESILMKLDSLLSTYTTEDSAI